MFLDSHRTVFTFHSWLDLLGVVLAIWIPILNIFKSLANFWHRITYLTSLEKVESSLSHTLKLLSKFGEMSFQEYISEWISPVFYGDLVYKLRRVKCEENFVSSGSKIVKRLRRQKYDPMIIKKTIGQVLGPSPTLYRSFLKHCTQTNKAVGTVWRDMSKPQMRQGHDPRPFWLLNGTPSVLGPELASRRAEHNLLWRMSLYNVHVYT